MTDLTLKGYYARLAIIRANYPTLQAIAAVSPKVQSIVDDYADGKMTEKEAVSAIMESQHRELTHVQELIMHDRITQAAQ